MNNTTTKRRSGLGICSVLYIIFITLKLLGLLNWSWLLVLTAPILITLACLIVVWGIVGLLVAISVMFKRMAEKDASNN